MRVFREHRIPVHFTEFTWHEVNEYLPRLAGKYRLPLIFAELRFDLLRLRLHVEESYKDLLPWARAALAIAIRMTLIRWLYPVPWTCLSGPTTGIFRFPASVVTLPPRC